MSDHLLSLQLHDGTQLTVRGSLPQNQNSPIVGTTIETETRTQAVLTTHDGGRHDCAGHARINSAPLLFEQTSYEVELVRPPHSTGTSQLFLAGKDLLKGRRCIGGSTWVLPINFESEIGYSRLELWTDERRDALIRVEVFPTKIDYQKDYLDLRADLQLEIHSLVHALHGRTYRNWKRVRTSKAPSDLEWLAQFESLFDHFVLAVEHINREPRQRFVSREIWVDPSKAKRASARIHQQLQRSGSAWRAHPDGITMPTGERLLPDRLPDSRRCLDQRTPENLFVAYACGRIQTRIRKIAANIPTQNAAEQVQRWSQVLVKADREIRRIRQLPLLAALGEVREAPQPSLAMHLTPGYREVHEIWLDLQRTLEIGGGPFELSEKDVATLYELWCFVALGNLLRHELKMQPRTSTWLKVDRRKVEVGLHAGKTSVLELTRDNLSVRVIYNQTSKSPTGSFRPDNTLEIEQRIGKTGRSFRYIFDAKYRLRNDADYLGIYKSPGPPADTINRMHAYRDQIVAENTNEQTHESQDLIWDTGYRRWVQQTVAAIVLFPYAGADAEKNMFVQSIAKVGVGALPFLPSRRNEVATMLKRIAAASAETVEDTAVELSSTEERKRIAQAHEYGLLAIVKNEAQLNYIKEHHIYHMPYVEDRGLRLRADFVAFLLSKSKFGKNAGAQWHAPVRSVHFGLRKEISPQPPPSERNGPETRMIWFKLGELEEATHLRDYSGHSPHFGFTTRLAWNEATDIADVLLVREPERRMTTELRAAGWRVRVLDDRASATRNFDLAALRILIKATPPDHASGLKAKAKEQDVSFNPNTSKFSWDGGEATWRELMFEPASVIDRILDSSQLPSPNRPSG